MSPLLLGLVLGHLAAAQVLEIDRTLPSRVAGAGGIPIRVAVPPVGRYGAEAPVAIHVSGGWGRGRLDELQAPLAALGFIELRFEFPPDDARGPASVACLAEVINFAAGRGRTATGETLPELTAPLVPLTAQVGLLGWSNGGNAAVLALAAHDEATRGVAWLAMWETPVGDGAPTALAGDWRTGANRAYDPRTGEYDWSRLRYDPTLAVRSWQPGPPVAGAFWFDVDRNGRRDDRDATPAAFPVPEPGGRLRFAYPVTLLAAATERGLCPVWPEHLLTAPVAAEFWAARNAAGQFRRAMVNRPYLLTMVLATDRDHVQVAADHPHILAAYNGWLEAGCRFVRLNPDAVYLRAVAGDEAGDKVIETVANLPLSRRSLPLQLVPRDLCAGAQLGAAAAAEMADRCREGHIGADLTEVLHPTPRLRRPAAAAGGA